jgi:hypothetical protein
MTTVAWNGVEMVSDSRVTKEYVDNGTKTYHDTFRTKLINGAGFFMFGKQVQAIGFSGAVDAHTALIELGMKALEYNLHSELSMLTPSTLFDSPLSRFGYNLIVVTAEHVYVVQACGPENVFNITQGPRATCAVIGSSFNFIQPILNLFDNARALVTYASIFDKGTGGNYSIWDGKNFQSNVKRMSKLKAFIIIFTGTWRIAYCRNLASKKGAK